MGCARSLGILMTFQNVAGTVWVGQIKTEDLWQEQRGEEKKSDKNWADSSLGPLDILEGSLQSSLNWAGGPELIKTTVAGIVRHTFNPSTP